MGLLKLVFSLFGVHLEVAQAEVKKDVGRMIGAAVFMAVGAVFLVFVLLGLHVVGVFLLNELARLTVWASVLVVCGVDLFFGVTLLLVGRARLKKPVLEETRGLMKATVSVLREVA